MDAQDNYPYEEFSVRVPTYLGDELRAMAAIESIVNRILPLGLCDDERKSRNIFNRRLLSIWFLKKYNSNP